MTALLAAAVAALAAGAGAAQAGPPPDFRLETIVAGLEAPTSFAFAPDGTIFVAEKAGMVKVVRDGRISPFLDLRDRVNHVADRGLISLELDPEFASNRRLYLLFTRELHPETPDEDTPAAGSLIRVEVSRGEPPRPTPGSEQALLSDFRNKGIWHSVAGLAFDGQGRLLVGLGDGHLYFPEDLGPEAVVAQDLDELNGKIVRLDPETGHGVPDNPWFDAARPGSVRSRILAYGLREPFRIWVDEQTGDIYVGDVGSDHWEEIDVIPPSVSDPERDLNYGWPCYEGAPETPYRLETFREEPRCVVLAEAGGAVRPAYAYEASGGQAIVLGPRYAGGPYPDEYDGRLFFADYSQNAVWTYDGEQAIPLGGRDGWGNPVALRTTPSGSIAYAAIGEGRLVEIVYRRPSVVPVALTASLGGAGILGVALAAWALRGRSRRRPADSPVRLAPQGDPLDHSSAPEPVASAADASLARAVVALERRRDFRMHVFLYAAWTVFLTAVWVVSEHERTDTWPRPFADPEATMSWNLWIVYPIVGWGLVVAFHAFVTLRRPVTQRDVEDELRRLRGD